LHFKILYNIFVVVFINLLAFIIAASIWIFSELLTAEEYVFG